MAWPKKGTRKVTVDGIDYLWHFSGHCLLCSEKVITIGREGAPFVLFLDPYAWHFEFRPRSVVEAVKWATSKGWSVVDGPTRSLSVGEDGRFLWLTGPGSHRSCDA
ncbi:MAG: hypothetical protein AAFV32_09845 [Myxococcota bacterium]